MGPSTPRPPRRSKRERANERAPPQANIVPHLYNHANLKRDRMARGAFLVLALANCLKKSRLSSDHLPPTSLARTTNRARP